MFKKMKKKPELTPGLTCQARDLRHETEITT
jgi:hypothetical protein